MYFEPQTKEIKKDFFNFELLQEELAEVIRDQITPLIAVHGIRRTGKTSLIKVVLNSIGKRQVWIDGREISAREDFFVKLAEETRKHHRFKLEKITLKGVELSLAQKNNFDYLNKHKIALVIDEAQLLKRFRLDQIVAAIYDRYRNIKLILSGSDTGTLKNFLGQNNARAPLYGRAVYEMSTQRLEPEQARRFLLEGSKQIKNIFKDHEINETIAALGGIIGWLTKYGWYRIKSNHKVSLQKTIAEGKLVVKEEFLKFASRAEARYSAIVKLSNPGAEWAEIKQKLSLSDSQLTQMLKRLMDYGYLAKAGKQYQTVDPLLKAALA